MHGGRWNVIGQPCLYASGSKALCALEYAANVSLEDMPDDLSFTIYTLPDDACTAFAVGDLPADWAEAPAPLSTKQWGTKQLQTHFVLKLPSVVIPSEHNYVINTLHPDFKKLRIKEVEPFTFDKRIKK